MFNIFKKKKNNSKNITRKEGYLVPQVEFVFRENGKFVNRKSSELFDGKRVIIFSLPGAFTPTCSAYQLPGFEENYDYFINMGIDEIYCISVNDGFVMNSWIESQGIQKVKVIPDGNGYFTNSMGQLVKKSNFGFGERSWRYAAVVNNGVVEKLFEEPGKCDNAKDDPYGETTPDKVLGYLLVKSQLSK